jgi:hypothetical protein
MNDVLTRVNGIWEIQEIKNSKELNLTHIQDIALQYFVTKGVLQKDMIATIVLPDENEGYKLIDVTKEVKGLQQEIAGNIKHFKDVLDESFIPNIDISNHCEMPYKCSFWGYCH